MFAQNLNVILCEKDTKEAVLYANLFNTILGFGTVSDFNGSSTINYQSVQNSIKISHIGYATKVLLVSDLLKMDTLFLERGVELNEVQVLAEEVKLYKELHKVIVKTKAQLKAINGKASLLVESFQNDSIPLERLEAIGNLNYSKGKLNAFDVKMGRFGQNKFYSFFTLTPDKELGEIDLFLYKYPTPLIITQCSKSQIKKYYKLKRIIYKDYTIYSFESKNGKQFSGEITVYNSSNTIGKLVCLMEDIPNSNLVSVYEGNDLSIKYMQLDLQFDEDHRLVYFFKKQLIQLVSSTRTSDISNVIFLSNNEDNEKYNIPTTSPESDLLWTMYEKIARFPFDLGLWNRNFVFSENARANKSFEFFQTQGYVANISNYFSGELEEELDFNTRKWGGRLDYIDFNSNMQQLGFQLKDICFAPGFDGSLVLPDQLSNTSRIVFNERSMSLVNPLPEVFNLLPVISYTPIGNSNFIEIENMSPMWDRKQSYFFMEKDYSNLVGVNLFYDWLEISTRNYMDSVALIYPNKKYPVELTDDFIVMANEAFQKFNKYNNGLKKDVLFLVDWNEKIKLELEVNNCKEIAELVMQNPEKYQLKLFVEDLNHIADIYFDMWDYEEALYFYGSALKYSKNFEEDQEQKSHAYKRLIKCYRKTGKSDLADRVKQQAVRDGYEMGN